MSWAVTDIKDQIAKHEGRTGQIEERACTVKDSDFAPYQIHHDMDLSTNCKDLQIRLRCNNISIFQSEDLNVWCEDFSKLLIPEWRYDRICEAASVESDTITRKGHQNPRFTKWSDNSKEKMYKWNVCIQQSANETGHHLCSTNRGLAAAEAALSWDALSRKSWRKAGGATLGLEGHGIKARSKTKYRGMLSELKKFKKNV